MPLTDYTSYDEVRAALGVSTDELEDATLALGMYSDSLELELESVNLGVPSLFTTVAALPEADRTDSQGRFYRTAKLFATYAVAKQLLPSLPMFGPKDISDGKATVSRFADSPYRETSKRVEAKYDELFTKLTTAYDSAASTTTATVTLNLLSVVNPATDPVVE